MEHERAAVAAPGLDVITKLRADQQLGRRTAEQHNAAHARFEKAGGVEGFGEALDRLHPLSRSVPAGVSYGEARLPESRAVKPRGNFDFGPGEPGNRDGSGFEWDQRFDPPRRVGIVPDAAGRLRGDGRARPNEYGDINDGSDHWASGRMTPVQAAWLLDAARSLIEAVRSAKYGQGRV